MFQIRKIFKFEGSHILSSAYSTECSEHIHGHSYKVELFLRSKQLNVDGMVVDFKRLKQKVKSIFDDWDHAFVIHSADVRKTIHAVADMKMNFNPTAENMARYFYYRVRNLYPELYKVRVHETDTGYAEYWKPINTSIDKLGGM